MVDISKYTKAGNKAAGDALSYLNTGRQLASRLEMNSLANKLNSAGHTTRNITSTVNRLEDAITNIADSGFFSSKGLGSSRVSANTIVRSRTVKQYSNSVNPSETIEDTNLGGQQYLS